MGTQSWLGIVLLGAMLATAGHLAVATGAWPDRVALFRGRTGAIAPDSRMLP